MTSRNALRASPRREPASVELAHRLLDYLLSGEVALGGRIPPERQLAEVLEVGRSAVREALKSLTLLGLLDVRQGDGTYLVSTTSNLLPKIVEWGLLLGERRVAELVETRSHIEIVLAGLAAQRRSGEQLATLQRLIDEMTEADACHDLERYIAADVAFHLALGEASGNQVLSDMLGSVRSLLSVWTSRVIHTAGETAFSLKVHIPILNAVRARDPQAAREAMGVHMTNASRHLQETLGADAPPRAEPPTSTAKD